MPLSFGEKIVAYSIAAAPVVMAFIAFFSFLGVVWTFR
jgi:hypothetical protein